MTVIGFPRDALRLLQEHLEIQEKRLESLRQDVAVGIEALNRGEYDEFDADDVHRLASQVKARGRERLRGACAKQSASFACAPRLRGDRDAAQPKGGDLRRENSTPWASSLPNS